MYVKYRDISIIEILKIIVPVHHAVNEEDPYDQDMTYICSSPTKR